MSSVGDRVDEWPSRRARAGRYFKTLSEAERMFIDDRSSASATKQVGFSRPDSGPKSHRGEWAYQRDACERTALWAKSKDFFWVRECERHQEFNAQEVERPRFEAQERETA